MRPFKVMIGLLRLVAELLWSRLTKSSNLSQYGRRARIALERLGPLWIKAGQILSLRGDLFSTEACVELAKIQESAEGMSFEWVRGILEQELERPLESVFEQFGKTPFGATPLAQLHRAYLRREQVWVVVKVQKIYARRIFSQDRGVLWFIAWVLKRVSPYTNLRWEDLGRQLEDLMEKELDFRYEASSLRRLKKKLRKHEIYVPETFRS